MSINDYYEQQNDTQIGSDIRTGDTGDNDYVGRTGQSHNSAQKDEATVEDPIDPETADSDAQLEKGDRNAINEENIIDCRTRGAAKKSDTYAEPGDEEGLLGPDDRSSSKP